MKEFMQTLLRIFIKTVLLGSFVILIFIIKDEIAWQKYEKDWYRKINEIEKQQRAKGNTGMTRGTHFNMIKKDSSINKSEEETK